MFAHVDLGTVSGYCRFLAAQAAAHLPIEQALEDAEIANFLADWAQRRRADALRADLRAMGLTVAPLSVDLDLGSEMALLGAVYVLEGSRLGGAMLKRSVTSGLPVQFLSANRPALWRTLIAKLDATLDRPERIDAAVRSARAVFDVFERSGRRIELNESLPSAG